MSFVYDAALEEWVDETALEAASGDHFKGVFVSLATLEAEWPSAFAGDYAQVDDGAALVSVVWDVASESWRVVTSAGSAGSGLSAFQVAVADGFVGSEAMWLLSLHGADGAVGVDGLSAYQLAVGAGFIGSEAAWLASLPGRDGSNGVNGFDGLSAYQVAVGAGFVGSEAAWLASLKGTNGTNGTNGAAGLAGKDGVNGVDGLSAYQLAVGAGFIGSQAAWLASLKGTNGTNGTNGAAGLAGKDGVNGITAFQVAQANGFVGSEVAWLASLHGKDGVNGAAGLAGKDGVNGLPGKDGVNGVNGVDGQFFFNFLAQAQSFGSAPTLVGSVVLPAGAYPPPRALLGCGLPDASATLELRSPFGVVLASIGGVAGGLAWRSSASGFVLAQETPVDWVLVSDSPSIPALLVSFSF
jgi:hypothetical protein